jgi:PAS domain S-box-containing protein
MNHGSAVERLNTSLDAIIDQMAEGLLVFDENITIVRANQQAQFIFGFSFQQLRSDRELALAGGRFADEHGRVLTTAELPVQRALAERRVVDSRLWYTRPDGVRTCLSLTASPFLNEWDQPAGAIVIARDVTEQHREHEREQQADKLRALGQLASGIAHNFNNSLAAVIGYTQLALPRIKEPTVEKYLRVVEQAAKDAARMIERIQNFARESAHKDDLIMIRLADIVRDAVDITRPRWRDDAEALGIKYQVKLELQSGEDLLVRGEPSELREVFVNVILNALDAMAIGGTITIAINTPTNRPVVYVTFSDTGVGMTEEIEQRIFEPFFTTKGVSGLGMGLSESYRIIERHGGHIEVESEPLKGSIFKIVLPHVKGDERDPGSLDEQVSDLAGRVLIVDDEERVRGVIAEMLEGDGHQVSTAGSGEEALQIMDSHEFDIVLTDLSMPKTDGVTLAAEIKSRTPKTRVVLMTGYGGEKAYERAGRNQCIDAALSKPFDLNEISRTVKRLLVR